MSSQLGSQASCATNIAIFPFVLQFAAVEPGWSGQLPLLALTRWLGRWSTHPCSNIGTRMYVGAGKSVQKDSGRSRVTPVNPYKNIDERMRQMAAYW
jgi:hypothetical protein